MKIFTFYLSLATHEQIKQGLWRGEWRKTVVAANSGWEAYKTAVDMAWRQDDPQVTSCNYVMTQEME